MENRAQSVGRTSAKRLSLFIGVFIVAAIAFWFAASVDEPSSHEPGVIVFHHMQRSESTEQRAQGFIDAIKREFPAVSILSSDQYLGPAQASAVNHTRLVLDKFGEAITGIFCVNEPNAVGCLQTLENTSRAGVIPFVGFDSTAAMLEALKQGKMAGIVVQDPIQIGYQTVNTALAHLRGESVKKRVITPHRLVTAENFESEELQTILYPERFSGAQFGPNEAAFTIGVVSKGLTHEYWQSVRAGAERAAREAGDTLIRFEAPVFEDDVEGQKQVVRKLIEDNVSAICLSPIDSVELVDVVAECNHADVPVVIFDSGLDLDEVSAAEANIVSYVATDNYEAGATAAKRLVEALAESSR